MQCLAVMIIACLGVSVGLVIDYRTRAQLEQTQIRDMEFVVQIRR